MRPGNVVRHLWGTTLHKFWVLYYMTGVALRLILRALRHDLSKYSSQERQHFFKTIHKLKTTTYGTPAYQALLDEIRPALDHHYNVNRHHPEFHKDGIEGFDLVDLIEMVCDWQSAVRRHADGKIERSIEANKERFNISRQLTQIISNHVTKR